MASLEQNGLRLREASLADAQSVTNLTAAAFNGDPQWEYRYPLVLRKQFADDHLFWLHAELASYLDQPTKFKVFLVETIVQESQPVGIAVWDIALAESKRSPWTFGLGQRRDANVPHCEAFARAGMIESERYFGRYGNSQLDLYLLAVHPEHRRKGVGTMLVRWGIQVAKEKGWPVTLIAGRMGELLYTTLGFVRLGAITIQAEGDEEKLIETMMEKLPI